MKDEGSGEGRVVVERESVEGVREGKGQLTVFVPQDKYEDGLKTEEVKEVP